VSTSPHPQLELAIEREVSQASTRKRVVAIDDETVHLRTMHAIIGGLGFVPVCVTGPMGATNTVARVAPALVVLDYNMPGVDGRQLCMLLRADKRTRDIPIVFFSAADPKRLETLVAETGAKGFIQKGSDIMSVRARLAGYLGV
jgi:putative two-component system response regulator